MDLLHTLSKLGSNVLILLKFKSKVTKVHLGSPLAVIWSGVEDETVLETSLSLDMVVTMLIRVYVVGHFNR